MSVPSFGPAEQMIVAMAREIEDGECLAVGIGTTLPVCAYQLAKLTHAPNCVFLYSGGGTFSALGGPLTLTGMEKLALRAPLRRVSYTQIVCDELPGLRFKEFSRPAQVDRFGNTNNVKVTTRSGRTIFLPGVGGVPDFSGYESHHAYLYVPRHDTMTLVSEVEFCSGAGAAPSRERKPRLPAKGVGSRKLITDLCVIRFTAGGAVLESLHAGVSVESVRARTGFPLEAAAEVPVTAPPTSKELALIREQVDPWGIRDLELVSSSQRLPRLQAVISSERSAQL